MKTKILTLLVFSLIGLYTYGEQYGVLVNKANGTNEVNFFEAPRTEDFGYDVQFLAHVQVEAGDYCQLYHADFETEGNCMDLWMCDLDPYSESDFVKNGDYLYATRAGCYDFYIKFGYYNRNLLYIGNGTNCITSDIILPKIKVGNLYYDLNIQNHTAEVAKNTCAYHSNVQGGTDYNNLLSITIPDYIVYNNVPFRVTSIGDAVFSSCKGLTSVELPNTLKSIGWEAFYNCSNLSTVTIPDSVINIGPKAFGGCNSLSSVVWNAKNCEDLYHSSYIFGDAPTTFIFGDNVEYIPNFICEGMTNLRSVTLGNNIKRIGVQAFIGNVSISSIVFPNSLTNIGDGAFSSCNGLTSVNIPNSVVSIGKDAFGECENLQVLTIGHNLANIGDYAFRLCSSLDTIYNYAPTPQMIEESVFLGVDKNACCLIVPDISETLYRSAWVWKDFFSINTIVSDSIFGINHETFKVTISAGLGGSVMPGLNEFVIPANTNININALPDNGYRFVSWSDGNTNANRTIVVNSNISLEAQFEAYCTLNVQVEPEGSGIVLFDGKESTSMDIIVEEGNTIQLTAVPQRGYRFVHYIDGINIITDTKYNVTMTTSKSITVVFEEKPITPPTPADNTPTVDDLEEAGYHVEDSVVVCLYFDEAPCNDVYMTGNYRTNSSGGWSTDINELKRFEALPGFSGWYAVEIPYTNNAMGKPVQLTSDGRFSWDYQCGDVNAWIYKGGERADIYSGFFDESDVFYYNPGCYIYELAYWKNHNNPCIIIPKHNYTIQLYTPEACSFVIPAVIGSFNNWNDFLPMSESTDLQGRKVYTYTVYGKEGQSFKFADSELGWYNELQFWDQSIGSWMTLNNYILPEASKDTTLIFDYSDITKYRFSLCLCDHAENVNVTTLQANATHNAVVVAWPAEDGATEYIIELKDDIDIVYTLRFNANGQLLGYYAPSRNGMSLQTQMATQTGTGWQYTITDLEPNTEYLYTVTAIYFFGSMVLYQQSLVFSTQNAPTAIDQITDAPSGITRKVIQNGQVFILRGDKTYTLQGQEVK